MKLRLQPEGRRNRDPHVWVRSWTGADAGCKRKLLLSKAVSDMQSIQRIKSIDPIAHALYKTWTLERYVPSADVYMGSYNQLTNLIKDTALVWKCSVGQER